MDSEVRLPEADEPPVERDSERLGHWPFRIVNDVEGIQALAMWLKELGGQSEQSPLGIAVREHELAFATAEQGWVVRSPSEVLGSVLVAVLLTERASPTFIARNIPDVVSSLFAWWLPEEAKDKRDIFIGRVIHDMTALSYCIGRPIATNMTALQDALDAATVGYMMALDSPRFYQQVGLPVKKEKARVQEWKIKGLHRWTLTYDYLLFKVLTHYTRDPTFVKWWQEGVNPLKEFGSLLELDSAAAAAFLLWMCCSEDEALLANRYPNWFPHLPENPQLIKATKVDKRIPTLRLGLLQLTEGFAAGRRATTLYGRLSPWGLQPAELLHFTLFGSVNDLLDVALASFMNTESQYQYLVPEAVNGYSPWLRAQFIGYTDQDPLEWQRELEQVGALSTPLRGVDLTPKVSIE